MQSLTKKHSDVFIQDVEKVIHKSIQNKLKKFSHTGKEMFLEDLLYYIMHYDK